eukprot:scaffold288994_cov36-Tisochrysis_lutea.AAC.2
MLSPRRRIDARSTVSEPGCIHGVPNCALIRGIGELCVAGDAVEYTRILAERHIRSTSHAP